ncbi:hypothetical protein INR49_007404, partial [Caranx melampygus]
MSSVEDQLCLKHLQQFSLCSVFQEEETSELRAEMDQGEYRSDRDPLDSESGLWTQSPDPESRPRVQTQSPDPESRLRAQTQ